MATEHRGPVEIRWAPDGDPDDVVAPYGPSKDTPVFVHIERMNDGLVWLSINWGEERCVMWFTAKKKGELDWFVDEPGA